MFSNKQINKVFLFRILLLILLIGCRKDSDEFFTTSVFYDSNNKLWAHRVNTAKEAIVLFKEFSGVEIDLRFINGCNRFETGHDASIGLNLTDYLDSIPYCNRHYYWLDFKNLQRDNVVDALSVLQNIANKYKIKEKIIVESKEPELLYHFKQSGFFTSYWVADVSDVLLPYFAEQELRKEIEENIKKYPFSILSSSYEMVPFLNKYFNNHYFHIWTNGLSSESDKAEIKELAKDDNIKIILVDYKQNFLKPERNPKEKYRN